MRISILQLLCFTALVDFQVQSMKHTAIGIAGSFVVIFAIVVGLLVESFLPRLGGDDCTEPLKYRPIVEHVLIWTWVNLGVMAIFLWMRFTWLK